MVPCALAGGGVTMPGSTARGAGMTPRAMPPGGVSALGVCCALPGAFGPVWAEGGAPGVGCADTGPATAIAAQNRAGPTDRPKCLFGMDNAPSAPNAPRGLLVF